jgi:tetratricopeptide (TPR) repeat protein
MPTQAPKADEQPEGRRSVIGFALDSRQRVLCLALGIALMAFGCFSFVRDEPSWPAAVPLLAGAAIFAIGLLGQLVRFRFGPFAVEPFETGESGEAAYPTSAPEEPSPEQSAPPPPTPREADLTRVEIGVSDQGVGSDAVHVEKREPFADALRALDEKEYSTFDSKMQEAIHAESDEDTKVAMEALRLEELYRVGQTGRLGELQALREKHPTSPYPVMRLGDCYDLAADHENAAALYGKGYEIPSLNADQRVMLLSRQARALRKAKLFEEAEKCLTKGLDTAATDAEKADVEKLLAELYEDWGKKHETLTHFEKALELEPGDVDARFKLAYRYSKAGYKLVAFYHYEVLRAQRDGPSELNNLGVILRELDMPIATARFYRWAADQKNTLAAANLARLMADGGLVTEASEVLAEALKEEKVDPAVHQVSAGISRWQENEEERLERIKEAAATERSLLLERFELERQDLNPVGVEDIEGTWQTSVGDMTFQRQENRLVARFKPRYRGWELAGDVSGRTYSFSWKCDEPGQNQQGDGFFIFRTDGEFEGIIRHTPAKGEVRLVTGSERKPPGPPEEQGAESAFLEALRRRTDQA